MTSPLGVPELADLKRLHDAMVKADTHHDDNPDSYGAMCDAEAKGDDFWNAVSALLARVRELEEKYADAGKHISLQVARAERAERELRKLAKDVAGPMETTADALLASCGLPPLPVEGSAEPCGDVLRKNIRCERPRGHGGMHRCPDPKQPANCTHEWGDPPAAVSREVPADAE